MYEQRLSVLVAGTQVRIIWPSRFYGRVGTIVEHMPAFGNVYDILLDNGGYYMTHRRHLVVVKEHQYA